MRSVQCNIITDAFYAFFSLPTWQDCHEMWCKKRRRKGEGKVTDDGGSAKQVRRESVADTLEPSNSLPAQGPTESQDDRTLVPLEASTFLRRHSIETVEMETEDMAANAYAGRDEDSFYDREESTQYSYTDEHPKAAYSQDSYYQRDYQRDYGEGRRNSAFKTSEEDYSRLYSRDDIEDERGSRYSQSSMHYEQLSPPVDKANRQYTNQYKHYSYADGSREKEYDKPSSRYREESASYLYRERYSESFSQKREIFDYSDSQYEQYSVATENRSSSSPHGVETYPRW